MAVAGPQLHQAHRRVGRQRQDQEQQGAQAAAEAATAERPAPYRGAGRLPAREGPEQAVERHQQPCEGEAHCEAVACERHATLPRSVSRGGDDAADEEQGVHQPDAVGGGEDAPERVHLAVRLHLEALERDLPVHAAQGGEALAARQLEELGAVLEEEAAGEAPRVAEEFVPVVVVGRVRGEVAVKVLEQVLLVPAALLQRDLLVPLVEDHLVDGPYDAREEEAAAEGSAATAADRSSSGRRGRQAGAVEGRPLCRVVRGEHQIGEEVEELGHEAHVPGLAPDQEVGGDLGELPGERQRLGLVAAEAGLQRPPAAAPDLRQRGRRLLLYLAGLAGCELGAPQEEALQELGVHVPQGLHEQRPLFHPHALRDGTVRDQRGVGAPEREQVVELVAHAVALEVEALVQGSEEGCRAAGEGRGAGQRPEAGGHKPGVLQLGGHALGADAPGRHGGPVGEGPRVVLQRTWLRALDPHEERGHGRASEHQEADAQERAERHRGGGPMRLGAVGRPGHVAALPAAHDLRAPSVDGVERSLAALVLRHECARLLAESRRAPAEVGPEPLLSLLDPLCRGGPLEVGHGAPHLPAVQLLDVPVLLVGVGPLELADERPER
mmetsp:Transcript_13647/g.40680  ORF Transcript_13647/g.40680 Transcript_13647/m.40680 type:complete len:610 (-) Transcript_13647:199-2028(-)